MVKSCEVIIAPFVDERLALHYHAAVGGKGQIVVFIVSAALFLVAGVVGQQQIVQLGAHKVLVQLGVGDYGVEIHI